MVVAVVLLVEVAVVVVVVVLGRHISHMTGHVTFANVPCPAAQVN